MIILYCAVSEIIALESAKIAVFTNPSPVSFKPLAWGDSVRSAPRKLAHKNYGLFATGYRKLHEPSFRTVETTPHVNRPQLSAKVVFLSQCGLSGSFKVNHFGTNRTGIGDFLLGLVINSNLGDIFRCFQDNWVRTCKNHCFYPPLSYLTPSLGVIPWELHDEIWPVQTRIPLLIDAENCTRLPSVVLKQHFI